MNPYVNERRDHAWLILRSGDGWSSTPECVLCRLVPDPGWVDDEMHGSLCPERTTA
jgi:hypothetical protein